MNLGIVVPHMGSSQMAYETIKLANRAKDAVVFVEQLVAPCTPVHCGSMCITEISLFSGLLITSTIENTMMASEIVNRKKVKLIFYVWDLEWLRPNKANYLYNLRAYNTPDILVVRSKEHVGPLTNYCNRQPIVKEFSEVTQC